MDEFVSVWTQLVTHPRWESIEKVLYDLRRVAAMLDAEDVLTMVSRDQTNAKLLAGKRVAIVADVSLTYGMARMFEAMGESKRTIELASSERSPRPEAGWASGRGDVGRGRRGEGTSDDHDLGWRSVRTVGDPRGRLRERFEREYRLGWSAGHRGRHE
jgi:hypothetical protein